MLPARSAGSAPARMPVRIEAPGDEQQHAAVDGDLFRARKLVGEQRRARRRGSLRASSRPAAPPAIESSSASTSSCWNTRARPAPSAARIAISLRRASARVKSRLPTLAHAISRTSADGAEQHHQRRADVADDQLLQTARRWRPSRRSPSGTPARAASRSTSISDCACATLTPGFSRATTWAL